MDDDTVTATSGSSGGGGGGGGGSSSSSSSSNNDAQLEASLGDAFDAISDCDYYNSMLASRVTVVPGVKLAVVKKEFMSIRCRLAMMPLQFQ